MSNQTVSTSNLLDRVRALAVSRNYGPEVERALESGLGIKFAAREYSYATNTYENADDRLQLRQGQPETVPADQVNRLLKNAVRQYGLPTSDADRLRNELEVPDVTFNDTYNVSVSLTTKQLEDTGWDGNVNTVARHAARAVEYHGVTPNVEVVTDPARESGN